MSERWGWSQGVAPPIVAASSTTPACSASFLTMRLTAGASALPDKRSAQPATPPARSGPPAKKDNITVPREAKSRREAGWVRPDTGRRGFLPRAVEREGRCHDEAYSTSRVLRPWRPNRWIRMSPHLAGRRGRSPGEHPRQTEALSDRIIPGPGGPTAARA
jgi:hypothetical protein